MIERMDEWMNERMNEWINEEINDKLTMNPSTIMIINE